MHLSERIYRLLLLFLVADVDWKSAQRRWGVKGGCHCHTAAAKHTLLSVPSTVILISTLVTFANESNEQLRAIGHRYIGEKARAPSTIN